MAYTYDDAIRLLSDHYGPITRDWIIAAIAAHEREKIAQELEAEADTFLGYDYKATYKEAAAFVRRGKP